MTDATNIPFTYLDQHADEPQELLELLCRQPSVRAQNLGMTEMAALIESLLQDAGFATQRLHTKGAPVAIYGELRGRSPYTLLLYNHYDVQPAEPLHLWHSPPFEPEVRDGRFYARGAADNKGEIAARLAAIRALYATHGELPITIRWIIEGEEEVGSPHFDALAAEYAPLLQADGAFWEGSGFDETGRPIITLGTKGMLYVQLDVQGTGVDVHSGNATFLPSAPWRLVQALATLRTPEGRVRIPGFYEAVQPLSEAERAACADQSDMDEQLKALYQVDRFVNDLSGAALREYMAATPTCNIAGLYSGYTEDGAKTILPAKAMAKVDFRLVPNQDARDILAKLRAYLQAEGYDDIRVTPFGSADPVVTPIEHPFVEHMVVLSEAFAHKPPVISPIIGGTLPLLGALRKHVGVPGVKAPGNPIYWGSGPHAPNEHIRLTDLYRAVQFNCHIFQALGQ